MKTPVRFLLAHLAGVLLAFCLGSCAHRGSNSSSDTGSATPFVPDPANSPAQFPANY